MNEKKLLLKKVQMARLDSADMTRIAGGYTNCCTHTAYEYECGACMVDSRMPDTSCAYILQV